MHLSRFALKRLSLWLGLLALVFLVGRGCVFRPATALPGSHFNGGTNAAWLDIVWVNEPHSTDEVAALAHRLAALQIRDAYVYVSYLKPHGSFNPTYGYAAEFTRAVRAAEPDLKLHAWLGLPLNNSRIRSESGYVELGDAATRSYIANFCADIVHDGGFDGVQIDAEPVPSGDGDLLALLDEVRAAMGPGPILSIASPHIQPILSDVPLPIFDRFLWRASYYREVARRVDQIALMTYDSHLPLPTLYRLYGRFQVIALTQALDGIPVEAFVGVPTSEEATVSHSPSAENMETGLLGTIDGLNDAASKPGAITGVAIYPEWETDTKEWATYESLWLGR